jgi:hypothetical protein
MAVVSWNDDSESSAIQTSLNMEVTSPSDLFCSTACRLSCGLAKLLPRDVDYSEASTLLSKSLKVCLDEYLNRFIACINLNPNGRISEIYLVSSTVLSSDNGMRHFCITPWGTPERCAG